MKVYVRKIFPHDVTHEVSLRVDIVDDFFEGKTTDLYFTGKLSGSKGIVTINNATDPRFGGCFKSLISDEGKVKVNDILLIYKISSSEYKIEIVKQNDERYFDLMVLFRGKNRHYFLETEEELKIVM